MLFLNYIFGINVNFFKKTDIYRFAREGAKGLPMATPLLWRNQASRRSKAVTCQKIRFTNSTRQLREGMQCCSLRRRRQAEINLVEISITFGVERAAAVAMTKPEVGATEGASPSACTCPRCPGCRSDRRRRTASGSWRCCSCGRRWTPAGGRDLVTEGPEPGRTSGSHSREVWGGKAASKQSHLAACCQRSTRCAAYRGSCDG